MTHPSQQPADFGRLFAADLLVRSAYQIGKAPVLVLLAASLGAEKAYLGLIVSVSVMTGIVCKPLVGVLSDRWGHRRWLLVGTGVFACVPFVYGYIETPAQLAVVRLLHGLATAIYGPVTIAAVVRISQHRVAERLGWFGWARGGGYIIGPTVGGWLLLTLAPADIYLIVGGISALAFLPVLWLSKAEAREERQPREDLLRQMRQALRAGSRSSALWIVGLLEGSMFMLLYTSKTFLPLYAMQQGVSVAWVGVFFSLQEGVHLVMRPWCGRLADRWSLWKSIALGLLCIGCASGLLPAGAEVALWLFCFALFGIGQALVTPAIAALTARQIGERHVGAGMGFVGALRNAGKVAGPILGGVLMGWLTFAQTLWLMGGCLLLLGAILWARRDAAQA